MGEVDPPPIIPIPGEGFITSPPGGVGPVPPEQISVEALHPSSLNKQQQSQRMSFTNSQTGGNAGSSLKLGSSWTAILRQKLQEK